MEYLYAVPQDFKDFMFCNNFEYKNQNYQDYFIILVHETMVLTFTSIIDFISC